VKWHCLHYSLKCFGCNVNRGISHLKENIWTISYTVVRIKMQNIKIPYTCFERNLRNVTSEPDREVSVLFIRSRMQAINWSNLELNILFSLWCLWPTNRRLEGCRAHRGKGTITLDSTPPLFHPRGVFKEIPRKNYSKKLGHWTWKQSGVGHTVFLRTLVCSSSGQWIWSGAHNFSKLYWSPRVKTFT
jgi:hypothetical protein